MEKQTVAVLGPGSWGTALHKSSMITAMKSVSGEISKNKSMKLIPPHTNQRYFKDIT